MRWILISIAIIVYKIHNDILEKCLFPINSFIHSFFSLFLCCCFSHGGTIYHATLHRGIWSEFGESLYPYHSYRRRSSFVWNSGCCRPIECKYSPLPPPPPHSQSSSSTLMLLFTLILFAHEKDTLFVFCFMCAFLWQIITSFIFMVVASSSMSGCP